MFVALAPVTRLDHTTSPLFKYYAGLGETLFTIAEDIGIYSILGHLSNTGIRLICKPLPEICKFGEGFLITQNPRIDD